MEQAKKFKRKKTLGSYPYISVVFSISTALFVIGLFGLLLIHANRLTEIIKENIEVDIYLKRNITENEKNQIRKTLLVKPYISKTDSKSSIVFVSKEESAKKFISETGENFIQFLGENPLRDAFIIKIKPDYFSSAELGKIKADIERIPGIFEVDYQENLINSINDNIAKISLLLIGFAAILIIVVVILINNTIKLALFSQRMLIRSMQLVGATSWFIKRPFIIRSLLHGIVSGLISSILLYFVLQYAYQRVPGLVILNQLDKMLMLFGILLMFGGFLGFICAYRSVRKYLKLSLDELY